MAPLQMYAIEKHALNRAGGENCAYSIVSSTVRLDGEETLGSVVTDGR